MHDHWQLDLSLSHIARETVLQWAVSPQPGSTNMPHTADAKNGLLGRIHMYDVNVDH